MDEIEIFPVRISNFLLCDVFYNALEHLSGIRRHKGIEPDGKTALGIQAAVAMGLPRDSVLTRGGAIRFRLLQRNAYVYHFGIYHHDFFQAAFVVRLLPDGNNDPADMQSKKYFRVKKIKQGILITHIKERNYDYVSFKCKQRKL